LQGNRLPEGQTMDDPQRDTLLQDVREQNTRLQQFIDAIIELVARSREVLRRQRPEDSAPATPDKPGT